MIAESPYPAKILLRLQNSSPETITCVEAIRSAFPRGSVLTHSDPHDSSRANEIGVQVFFLSHELEEWDLFVNQAARGTNRQELLAVIEHENPSSILKLSSIGIQNIIILSRDSGHLIARITYLLRMSEFSDIDRLRRKLLIALESDQFIGESEVFVESVRQIPLAAATDSILLISGETGTGKEAFARGVHYLGSRSPHPFIGLNCATVPENLFENELFGHTKGAYTDARETQIGLVRLAEGGTLNFDEVYSLSPAAQVKMLRLVEERAFKPLGSTSVEIADVRFVFCTNIDLFDEVRKGGFRQDLFYRINVLRICLPPLRARGNDILLLAKHFLDKIALRDGNAQMYFSDGALHRLSNHTWPGNVRELRNVIERAAVMSAGGFIRENNIFLENEAPTHPEKRELENPLSIPFREAKKRVIQEWGRTYLLQTLRACSWNITRAARAASMDLRSFRRLMRKLHIETAKSKITPE